MLRLAWDATKVSLAYSENSQWSNRIEFLTGREAICSLLTRKWRREINYRLIKELWTFSNDRVAVRFAYEYHDDAGQRFRTCDSENWQFNNDGLMERRFASITEHPIIESGRLVHRPLDRRPDSHAGLTELGL